MLGTSSTTSKSRDDAQKRREKRFLCWTRCSTNWTVTVRCIIPIFTCVSFFVFFVVIRNAFDERGDMSTSLFPLI